MKFNNFPIDVKYLIMSYLTPQELGSIVSPVSKEWNKMANDGTIWTTIHFDEYLQNKQTVIKLLSQTRRPHSLTMSSYVFNNDLFLRQLPFRDSLNVLELITCKIRVINYIQRFATCFPNIKTFKAKLTPFDGASSGSPRWANVDKNGVNAYRHLANWKQLKCLHYFPTMNDATANEILKVIAKQNLQLEDFVFLAYYANIKDCTLKTLIKYQGSSLQKFGICYSGITEFGYQSLRHCQKMTHLTIFYPNLMTNQDLLLILQELRSLIYFRMEYGTNCSLFSEEFRTLFANVKIPGIVELALGRCDEFCDEDLKIFVECLPSLKDLEFINLPALSNNGLKSLITICKKLEMLYIEEMAHVTKSCLQEIAENLPNMRELVACKCSQIRRGKRVEIVYDLNHRLLHKYRSNI